MSSGVKVFYEALWPLCCGWLLLCAWYLIANVMFHFSLTHLLLILSSYLDFFSTMYHRVGSRFRPALIILDGP